MQNKSSKKNRLIFERERLKIALLTGFMLAALISFTAGDEIRELSFLFPEFSISPSVKLNEESENKAKSSDDLVVEVEENEKPKVRFFIVDFIKSLI